jgi:hypothetical protein
MKPETIVALLIILCLGFGPTARLSVAQEAASDKTKITAEEEQEAREVAERFMRRLQETHDLAPLIEEMFVPDYAARLQQEASNKPLLLLSRSAVAQANREELVRYQLALNNSAYLASLIFLAYKTSHATEDDEQEWGATYYKRMLPPDILELCKHDPVLKMLLEEETDESATESAPAASLSSENSDVIDHDDEPIRSLEQLRSFTSTLEQAIMFARRHLAASPRKLTPANRPKGADEEENRTAEREKSKPRAWMLGREFYGYPKDTRILCVNVAVYHMDLIRVDGKLKVLALDLDMD